MVVSIREYIFVIVGSVVISLIVVAAIWPWARHVKTLVTIGLAAAVGILIWNTALNLTNAGSLNVDTPLLGLSVQDIGSGVGAFLITLLVLRFATNRTAPTGRVLAISAVVGLLTLGVDLLG